MLHILTRLSSCFPAVLVMVGGYCLFVACGGDDGIGIGCFEDVDCGSGFVCAAGRCEQTCTNDDDCGFARRCGSQVLEDGRTVSICGRAPVNNVNDRCETDAQCQELSGNPRAQCAIDGICFLPTEKYTLLIRDRTTGEDPLAPTDGGAGVDIAAIYLVDGTDQIVAQADTLVIQTVNGVLADDQIINGGQPSLDESLMCIDRAFEGNTVSLGGDGGTLLVRFLDTTFGDYEESPDTWRVVVVEWGQNCENGTDEPYDVFRCTSSSFDDVNYESDCTLLGNGLGRGIFEGSQ